MMPVITSSHPVLTLQFLPFFISNKLEQFCVSWTIYFITAIFLFMAKYRKNCSNEIFSLKNALAQYLANANFSQNQKSHQARIVCGNMLEKLILLYFCFYIEHLHYFTYLLLSFWGYGNKQHSGWDVQEKCTKRISNLNYLFFHLAPFLSELWWSNGQDT